MEKNLPKNTQLPPFWVDVAVPLTSLILSFCLPSLSSHFPFPLQQIPFPLCILASLKSPKNSGFEPSFFIRYYVIWQLLNLPESQFCQLYNEGGSHLRLVIYSSQDDIHTPAHCSARPSLLWTTARTHPEATRQTSGLISRPSFPYFYTYATHYFSLSFLYATTTSWKTTEWKKRGKQTWSWVLATYLTS